MKKLLLIAFLFTLSCGAPEENNLISPEYIIVESGDESNLAALDEIAKLVAEINTEGGIDLGELIGGKNVSRKKVITALFHPDNFKDCQIPEKVREAIIKTKGFKPAGTDLLNNLPDKIRSISGTAVSQVLHTVVYNNGTSDIIGTLNSAPTYRTFNTSEFKDENKNSFYYSFDCAGYLNSGLSLEVGVLDVANLKTSAAQSLRSDLSMFIANATIYSPVFSAFQNQGVNLSNGDKIGIIKSLIENNPFDTDTNIEIKVGKALELLWASTKGKKSSNGEAKFKGRASVGLPFASVKFDAKGGASMGMENEYESFETYLVNDKVYQFSRKIKIKDFKEQLIIAMREVEIINNPRTVDGIIEFALYIPENMHDLEWKIENANYELISKTALNIDNSSFPYGLKFNIRLKPNKASSTNVTLVADYKELKLKKVIYL